MGLEVVTVSSLWGLCIYHAAAWSLRVVDGTQVCDLRGSCYETPRFPLKGSFKADIGHRGSTT